MMSEAMASEGGSAFAFILVVVPLAQAVVLFFGHMCNCDFGFCPLDALCAMCDAYGQ